MMIKTASYEESLFYQMPDKQRLIFLAIAQEGKAGEVTGGIHGAERLGGNAVADICIFGKIAADSAFESLSNQN